MELLPVPYSTIFLLLLYTTSCGWAKAAASQLNPLCMGGGGGTISQLTADRKGQGDIK